MEKIELIYVIAVPLVLVLVIVGLLTWQIVQSQLKFQAICENSGNMVVIGKALTSRKGYITDIKLVGCNEVYARHLGASVGEITGRRIVRDFFDGHEPEWLNVVRESICTHESRHLEFTYAPLGTCYSGSVFCLSPLRKRCCFIMDEVSADYRRRNELHRIRKLMDSVLEMSGIGMWQWNLVSDTVYVIKATFKLVAEYNREEVRFEQLLEKIHPDDRERLKALRKNLPDNKKPAEPVEYRLDDKHGGWRWFQAVAVKTEYNADGDPEAVVGVTFDIHSLKRSRQKVEQISREFEANQRWLMYSLQQSRTGYCRWDVKTDKLFHSDHFWQSVGGLSPDEEAKHNIPDTMEEFSGLIVAEEPRKFTHWLESVHKGDPEDLEFRCHISFLPQACLEIRTNVLERDDDGKASVMSAFIIDITAIRQKEEALRAAIKAADEANKSKGRFLAIMSHEIRTPLNAIIGFSSIIKGADIPAKLQSYAESIKSSGEMLLGLINDLLDLAKIESSKMELKLEPVNLHDILFELQQIFDLRIKAKQLYFRVKCDDDLPLFSLDVKRVRQVLVNLVGNAVKFTAQGGVTLSVSVQPSAVDGSASASAPLYHLVISVRDTGAGIPAEDFDIIFNPFEQSNKNHSSYVEGSGLGLAICRNLVELMGGAITFESQLGEGSNFIVSLDKVESVSQNSEESSVKQEKPIEMPNTVPLPEDESIPREVFVEIYSLFGDRLQEMENGMHVQSALTLVADLNKWVDEQQPPQVKYLIDALQKAVEDFDLCEIRRIIRTFAIHGEKND